MLQLHCFPGIFPEIFLNIMQNPSGICRLCRQCNRNSVSLLVKEIPSELSLCEKLKEISQIEVRFEDYFSYLEILIFVLFLLQINPNDGLPTVACSLCVWNLNAAFKFVSECKISQEWFKKTLEENDTKDFVSLACVSSMPSGSILESCKNEESKEDVSEILSQVTVKIETLDTCPDAASSPHSVNSVKFEDEQDVGNPLETTPEIIEENPKSPRRKRAKKGGGKHPKEDGKVVRKRRRKPRDVKPRIGLICEACGK